MKAAYSTNRPAKNASAGRRSVQLEGVGGDHDQAELEQAERNRRPAGLVRQEPVIEGDVERQPDDEHQPGELERPPLVQERRAAATTTGRTAAASRVSIRPLSVYDTIRSCAGSCARRPSSRRACRRPERPIGPGLRQARASGSRPSAPGRSSRRRPIHWPSVSSPCSATRRARSGSCVKPRRSRSRRSPGRRRSAPLDAETALARREPSGSSQLRPGGYEASPRPCSNAARSACEAARKPARPRLAAGRRLAGVVPARDGARRRPRPRRRAH